MAQLHEVLAVDRDLEAVAKKMCEEAIVTFTKKTEHFVGTHKRLEMFDDSRKQEEKGQEEIKALTTTVQDKLQYVAEHLIRHIDCLVQKESTNQLAMATVMLNGKPFFPSLPATMLLALENKLTQWRKMYEEIPTLEPTVEWKQDEALGKNVFKAANDVVKHKTEKIMKPIVLYPHSDKHPAQVKESTLDVPVGNYISIQWSGKITPARKSLLLGRIDALLAEVKKARQRANSQEVTDIQIGKRIFDYLNAE